MLQNYLGTKLKSNKMAFVAISLTVLYSSFHLFFQNISSKPIIQVFLSNQISSFAFPLKPQVDEYIIIPRFLNSGKPEKKNVVIVQFF